MIQPDQQEMAERNHHQSLMNPMQSNAAMNILPGDLETRGTSTDHQDLRLWLRMMAVHKLITNEVRRRLRVSFNMSLSRFDLMAQLDATKTGIRMGEISSRLMVTTGNITGLTDELEADGLVERTVDPSSRRAFLVRLTAKGRKAFRAAAKANEGWIDGIFLRPAEQGQETDFRASWEAKDLRPNPDSTDCQAGFQGAIVEAGGIGSSTAADLKFL